MVSATGTPVHACYVVQRPTETTLESGQRWGAVLILTEGQFTIGDVISVGQFSGTVERITLRVTYLRDGEGKLNLLPNGDIRAVSNMTTQWTQVVITFNVDYEADMGLALLVLEETTHLVQTDSETAPAIVEKLYALCWADFTDWAVQMQIIAKTLPGQQRTVACATRKTALALLQKEDIRVSIPRQRIESMPD